MTASDHFMRDNVRAFLTMLAGMNRPDMASVPIEHIRARSLARFGSEIRGGLIQAGCDVTNLELAGNIHGFIQVRKAIPSAQADLLAILGAIKAILARTA